ncbi:uncharacterized protein LOC135810977 [Sycon ciliatum]|uniref:uncharacterized protein LOC135810977 n=1 Tax=Sycon ciliatum TaxID=27933 RepID=UPI0031F6AC72
MSIAFISQSSAPEIIPGTAAPSMSRGKTAPYFRATFSVDFDQQILRPLQGSKAVIRINEVKNGTVVRPAVFSLSPHDAILKQHPIYLNHYQLIFYVTTKLKIDATYSITMDNGFVVGQQSCTGGGAPFFGIQDPNRWQFVADHTVGNISDCGRNSSQFFTYGTRVNDTQLLLGNGTSCVTRQLANSANGFPINDTQHNKVTICENGLIMLDQDQPIRHPQLFPGNWTTQPTILAPYWCLADNSYSKNLPDGLRSHVWYHFYDRQVSSEKAMLEEIESLILAKERNTDKSFYFTATWAAIVTWERITPYPSRYKYQLHNTFQAVMATDGLRSYTTFAYDVNSIQWSIPVLRNPRVTYGHSVMGYSTPEQYYNDRRSGTFRISGIDDQVDSANQYLFQQACTEGAMYIFRLYKGVIDGPRAKCLRWYASQPDPRTWMKYFNACPQILAQAQADSRFQLIRKLSPRTCFQNSVPSITGSSQECCYRTLPLGYGAFLEGPPDGGNSVRFSWLSFEPTTVSYEETLPRQWCCEDSALCHLYWEKRPSQSSIAYSRQSLGTVALPIIRTIPGGQYTMFQRGNFLLVDSPGYFRCEIVISKTSGDGPQQVTSIGMQGNSTDQCVAGVSAEGALSFTVNGQPLSNKVFKVFSDDGVSITYECLQWNRNCTRVPSNSTTAPRPTPIGISAHNGFSVIVHNRTHGSVVFESGFSVDLVLFPHRRTIAVTVGCPQSLLNSSRGLLFIDGPSLLPIQGDAINRWKLNCSALQLAKDPRCASNGTSTMSPTTTSSPTTLPPEYYDDFWPQVNETCKSCKINNALCHLVANITKDLNYTKELMRIIGCGEVVNPIRVNTTSPVFISSGGLLTVDLSNVTLDKSSYRVERIPAKNSSFSDERTSTRPDIFVLAVDFNMKATNLQFLIISPETSATVLIRPIVYIRNCNNGGNVSHATFSSRSSERTRIHACECPPAYAGEFCEDDRDGCKAAYQPCSDGVDCFDKPAPDTGYLCGACPPGFTGVGKSCLDLDECRNRSSSPCQQVCANTQGNYTCACNAGFALNPDDKTCSDLNECTLNTDDCEKFCNNTQGSYQCYCDVGFALNGSSRCSPIRPCKDNGGCEQLCVQDLTTHTAICSCQRGYTLDTVMHGKCNDIDECHGASACSDICQNTNGSFLCHCSSGYSLATDKVTCEDIDECAGSVDLCPQDTMHCSNTRGSYACLCNIGYQKNNVTAKCEVISCGAPVVPANGGITSIGSDWHYGQTVTYFCNIGHSLIGAKRTHCLESGKWSQPVPTCQIINCPALPLAPHLKSSSNETKYGSIWKMYCSQGYTLQGNSQLKCLSTGTWSAVLPVCNIVHCSVPEVGNGTLLSNTTSFGSAIQVRCNDGYKQYGAGHTLLTCLHTGLWNGSFIECKECACNVLGSRNGTCDKLSGQCPCKTLTTGLVCSECVSGTHYLSADNQDAGCRQCNCSGRSAICTTAMVGPGVTASSSNCSCPAEYTGLNCEHCSAGYTSTPGPGAAALHHQCVACRCNNHSNSCNRDTGVCTTCRHNTAGEHCDRCGDGFYGTAVGQAGCTTCHCHQDGSVNNNCNHTTGHCLCRANILGRDCDQCQDRLYGFPSCNACACNTLGSVNTSCNVTSGQCSCGINVEGRQCDKCQANHYNFPSCSNCNCNSIGTQQGAQCNTKSGQCVCLPNVMGRQCDQCVSGYYTITSEVECDRCAVHYYSFPTCRPCNCDAVGTEQGTQCDALTGACVCLPGVTGRQCDQCTSLYYGFASGTGCTQCGCNTLGSMDPSCNVTNGQCPCGANVEGRQCDKCQANHYNFPSCSNCYCNSIGTQQGAQCNTKSGQCVCLPNVMGRQCDQCISEHYGISTGTGCTVCGCTEKGSTSLECNQTSGHCTCLERIVGRTCDQCEHNHFGYPLCGQCDCDPLGSLSGSVCNTVNGKCACKPFATGVRCDQCAPGFYHQEKGGSLSCAECACNLSGTVTNTTCSTQSGQCQCLTNVTGRQCGECAAFHYGLQSGKGCEVCPCLAAGSSQCHDNYPDFECQCKAGYKGALCDECMPDYYYVTQLDESCESPPCSARLVCQGCGCFAINSTFVNNIGKLELCNEDGQCMCNSRSTGLKCDICNHGYHMTNTSGCEGSMCT